MISNQKLIKSNHFTISIICGFRNQNTTCVAQNKVQSLLPSHVSPSVTRMNRAFGCEGVNVHIPKRERSNSKSERSRFDSERSEFQKVIAIFNRKKLPIDVYNALYRCL